MEGGGLEEKMALLSSQMQAIRSDLVAPPAELVHDIGSVELKRYMKAKLELIFGSCLSSVMFNDKSSDVVAILTTLPSDEAVKRAMKFLMRYRWHLTCDTVDD